MINQQLFELYSSKWDDLCRAMQPIIEDNDKWQKPAYPLLLKIDKEEEYLNADIRVMIFGQETKGWELNEMPKYIDDDFQKIINLYDDFYNHNRSFYKQRGPFMSEIRKLREIFEGQFSKKIPFVWNNIIKIGQHGDKGRTPLYIYEIERKYFSVIKDEIEILKPNVIIFLTGPSYYKEITDNFGKINFPAFSSFTTNQLSKVSLPEIRFAYRTYHPGYLYRKGREFKERVFNTILQDIV